MLEVRSVTKQYGGIVALGAFTGRFPAGRVTAVIGPNGSGKSTLLDVVAGSAQADSGNVLFRGRSVGGLPPGPRALLGIGRLYQDVRLFGNLSVLDNLLVAANLSRLRTTSHSRWFLLPRAPAGAAEVRHRATALLAAWGLAGLAGEPARHLSGGTRRVVGLLRLAIADPHVVLLDEPTAGLGTAHIASAMAVVRGWAQAGKAVILVEHNFRVVSELADSAYVLVDGRCVDQGEPAHVLRELGAHQGVWVLPKATIQLQAAEGGQREPRRT